MNEHEAAQALLSAPFVPGHKGKEKPSLLDIFNTENDAMPSVGILESQNAMDGSEEDGSKSQVETRLEQKAPGKLTFFSEKKARAFSGTSGDSLRFAYCRAKCSRYSANLLGSDLSV
jgi:hypothetical protein